MPSGSRKRRRPPGAGQVYQPRPGSTWWIRYSSAGKRHAENSHKSRKAEAEEVLRARLAVRDSGLPTGRDADALQLGHLADAIRADYAANSRRSGPRLEQSIKHLLRLIPAATPARKIDEETNGRRLIGARSGVDP